MAKKILTIKTKYGSFRCVFEPAKDLGGYVVEAKGVSGAITWGGNLVKAKKMAKEVIEGAIEAKAIDMAERKGKRQSLLSQTPYYKKNNLRADAQQ